MKFCGLSVSLVTVALIYSWSKIFCPLRKVSMKKNRNVRKKNNNEKVVKLL